MDHVSTTDDNIKEINDLISQSQLILEQIKEEKSKKLPDYEKIQEYKSYIQQNIQNTKAKIKTIQSQVMTYEELSKNETNDSIKAREDLSYAEKFQSETSSAKKQVASIERSLSTDTNKTLSTEHSSTHYCLSEKSIKKITNQDIKPCMGIDNLATAFVDLLSSLDSNDSQMIGLFGRWGRGKTYFFNHIERCYNKDKKYNIVKFNAWKYQETPAIWAYLYMSIQKALYPNWLSRTWYNIRKNWLMLLLNSCILIGFVMCLLFDIFVVTDCTAKWMFSLLAVFIYILYETKKIASPIINSLITDIKGKDYSVHLGCQASIEADLASVLKKHIKINEHNAGKKVILFFDDIDRCPENKIIEIIDSLRTILENEEIKKRLIVICAIDEDKLSRAIKFKYKDLYDNQVVADKILLDNIPREQMDKIFLSGIKLRAINNDEKTEFLQNLINEQPERDAKRSDSHENIEDMTGNNINNKNSPSASASYSVLTNEEEFKLLNSIIFKYKGEITPRQIRIIYYRFVLAKNILDGYSIPMDDICQAIFEKSMGLKFSNKKLPGSYCDVINTVVCY